MKQNEKAHVTRLVAASTPTSRHHANGRRRHGRESDVVAAADRRGCRPWLRASSPSTRRRFTQPSVVSTSTSQNGRDRRRPSAIARRQQAAADEATRAADERQPAAATARSFRIKRPSLVLRAKNATLVEQHGESKRDGERLDPRRFFAAVAAVGTRVQKCVRALDSTARPRDRRR